MRVVWFVVAAPNDDCRISFTSSEISTDTASRSEPGVYFVVVSGLAACAAGLKVTGMVGVNAALVSAVCAVASIYPGTTAQSRVPRRDLLKV